MKLSTLLLPLLPFLNTIHLIHAHPSNFSPNHAQLQKRCPPFDPAGIKNIGNAAGVQFIGGQCLSGADCQSGCCANPCGICSGLGAQTQAGKTGCGFGGGNVGSTGTGTGTGTAKATETTAPSTAPGTGIGTGLVGNAGGNVSGSPNLDDTLGRGIASDGGRSSCAGENH